jgi:hypothetical protein
MKIGDITLLNVLRSRFKSASRWVAKIHRQKPILDWSRKVRVELPCQAVGFSQLELCRFFIRSAAYFGLYVKVVLLDTKLEVIPFFAARAVLRILRIKPGKQLRFDGIVRELCNCFP